MCANEVIEAVKNSIHDQKLLYSYSTTMVPASQKAQPESLHDATRCQHMVELYI